MIWNIRKQKITNQNKKQKNESKKVHSVSCLWGTFKHSNIGIIGLPEGEEKEQEIGYLFEKTMKEKFLRWVKEINIQDQ